MTAPGRSPEPVSDRRQVDRRQGDRRQQLRRQSAAGGAETLPLDTDFAPAQAPFDARVDRGSSSVRIVRVYVAARALVGVALVAAQAVSAWLGLPAQQMMLLVSLLYAAQSCLLWLLPRGRELMGRRVDGAIRQRQWLLSIGVDLLAFSALHLMQLESSLSYAALLVLPVMMSGVLGPRVVALGTAAAVSIVLLAIGWRAALTAPEGLMLLSQQGMVGIGLFAIALLSAELSSRLEREERAALGSREMARRQALLNRLVLEEMAEGVLVVDRLLRVRAVNPAARALLSIGERAALPPFPLDEQAAWAPLVDAVRRGFSGEVWPEAGRPVELPPAAGHRLVLLVRMRFTRRPWGEGLAAGAPPRQAAAPGEAPREPREGEDYCVLFVEDMRTVQARLRQDKLAAMGRMSAGIAHEIRNPLAAIAQANELMAEETGSAQQRQLSAMVQDNVRRLQRIVDDVLEAAAVTAPDEPQWVDAREQVQSVVRDWRATNPTPAQAGELVALDLPGASLWVRFDPEHLRRVLVNLLDNGLRHGSGGAGAIQLRLAVRDDATAVISLASDGEPIPAEVERHLFEPFFSTRSRGSGLGLYICRELCERNGASIEYRPRAPQDRHRNAFVIVMQRNREEGGPLRAGPP